uniref:Integrase catalytic domain-containing protein n=1 Tax=Biomphalaria glabrata TaxID=6526 RepID=A0A2C9LLW4_BIOGL
MNQRETLIQHDVPWEKVGADLMEVDGRQYLITVDYYSNFIEYDYLSTTSQDVIRKLKGQFARFGAPKILITDGGQQFSSNEFLRFTRRWNINHIRSDPGYPRTNGKAEAAVNIMKNLILKTKHNGDDPYEALLELRNTPRH